MAPRSQRDALELRQEELRELRRQRETLPLANAELKSRVDALEQEVHWLRLTLELDQGERERPIPSLPDQLAPPFLATPSRRTAYGRMRFALETMTPVLSTMAYLGIFIASSPLRFTGLLLLLCVCFGLLLVLQGDEDDDELPAWSFGTDGFSQVTGPWEGHPVLYSEVRKVEVDQGWLQRRYGFGTVRITFQPLAPTPVGKALSYPIRAIDLDLMDDPERLAAWLRKRTGEARAKGGAGAR